MRSADDVAAGEGDGVAGHERRGATAGEQPDPASDLFGPSDAAEHIRRTPDAHGGDVVTVILADFRGLDTMVEITVLAVAIIGVASLLRRGRSW